MINIKNKEDCCGCTACIQRCPRQCISMQRDCEGFLYPVVDSEKCIDCGLCEKVCPVKNQGAKVSDAEVYAAVNYEESIREQSSSGGIFTLLAHEIIKRQGIVYGVKYNDEWMPVFDYTENIEGIASFRGSKYAQAIVGCAYKNTEEFLKTGREVMFCGTPCQIAGLKKYLRKEYHNLYAIDSVCHGVPSPLVWERYLDEAFNGAKEISKISMRDKRKSWKHYDFTIIKKDGTTYSHKATETPYIKGFVKDLYLRPSCHQCPAKQGSSGSDMTIADFWGIENVAPKIDDDKGCSAIIINSAKGAELYKQIDCKSIKLTIEPIIQYNSAYCKNSTSHPNRRKFFKLLAAGKEVVPSIEKSLKTPLYKKLAKKIKTGIRIILKKL